MRALFVIPYRQLDGAARALLEGGASLTTSDYFSIILTVPGGDVERMAHHLSLETLPIVSSQSVVARATALQAIISKHFVDLVFVGTEKDLLAAALAARWSGRGAVVQRVGAGETFERQWRSRLAQRMVRTGFLVAAPHLTVPPGNGVEVLEAPLGVRLPTVAADVVREAHEPRLTCITGSGDTDRRALGEALRAFALLRQRFSTLRLAVVGERRVITDGRPQLHAAALGVSKHVDWIADPLQRDVTLGGSTIGYVAAGGDDGVYGWLDLMAHGVPFVALQTPLAERYAANGIHGVLLATLDPARAAAELAVMLASPARREAMGAASRARVARDFNDRTAAQPFEQVARRLRATKSS
ncbi:MAG: glycosyltransferase [Gemmatimonadaceae bacterium]